MNRIAILDDTLISKIAAGEVIERPASAVKELVENAIDAGAKKISIDVKDGGKKLIRVSDDGSGMNREEAKLSIERHSTSKIKTAEDLFNIHTLGFRGEALPSIASVSRFEMSTNDGKEGTKLRIDGGKIKAVESAGGIKGTTITIEELFYNTPARLKFQKSRGTEMSHIVDIISKFILSNPSVAFQLKSDGADVLSSIGSGELLDAIASIYGKDMARAMIKIDNSGSVKVHGYITQPVITKSDRNGESIFVNGRTVRNMLISKALEEPYRTLIPNGKYPLAVLFVDINPADVDVNVHPTKREIKFARADEAIKAVSGAVSKALSAVGAQAQAPAYSGSWKVTDDQWNPEKIQIQEFPMSNDKFQINSQSPMTNWTSNPVTQHLLTYIICPEGSDLLIIDQHAAHERIMYEKIKNRTVTGTQDLLVAQTIELEPAVAALISGHLDELKELGFNIENFGKNSIIVRGVPVVLTAKNIDEAVKETLSELSDSFRIKSVEERRESMWKMMACKAAVKAGDKLSMAEMEGLVEELKATSNPTTCPHGRPTMVRISKEQMEKMFGR